ncbi:type-F conjugative transfer system protein TraW (plasmid) [Legionella israelensis]|uniref:type-F conjugative transfer system protein TraW n=1 Tax=Legionella israelensis TaxID=454 RepID=UPI00117D09AC|nr:type-F conjugative transfer system protein TraW [Legionella israelensis]QDP73722.1 type-F conjugative transfer system protein TraW [Legionella israelensis]
MKGFIRVAGLSVLLIAKPMVYAKNLGTTGELWPVKEMSLLKLMESKAAGLNTDEMARQWQSRAGDYADRPEPLYLKRGRRSKVHHYTPVASVRDNVTDINGKVIVPSNASVNVLTLLPDYQPELLFFNADDRAQLLWAHNLSMRLTSNARFILTGGSVAMAEKALNGPVYFDQKGVICKKFGISQMPAIVTRDRMDLVILEPLIGENGHEI